jgi:hypothetical protein
METINKIVELVKDDISSEKLEKLLILLNDLDTEARADIVIYARAKGYIKDDF